MVIVAVSSYRIKNEEGKRRLPYHEFVMPWASSPLNIANAFPREDATRYVPRCLRGRRIKGSDRSAHRTCVTLGFMIRIGYDGSR
jgi:hypothetical protein